LFFCEGASIKACKALKRHILALEEDLGLVEEVLQPLIPLVVEVQPTIIPSVSESSRKRPLEVDDDEPEVKTAPKRRCK
jgi:hypothetical protein